MGKSLKGRELGTGISQRKDGLYTASFTGRDGKRHQKYFKKLQECRNWLADAQFQDEHGNINAWDDMAVSAWFYYWIENFKAGNEILNAVKKRIRMNNIVPMQYHDTVFVSSHGKPIDNSSHNAALIKLCDKAGIKRISMHTLRHTFATRCIESNISGVVIGVNPIEQSAGSL